ncbi:flap structure-specific endonuclease [Methanomicrobiaceae archaeon CYW5]|uniref:flap endonuclease-1 n=1 Tax=Methanovulcanius yangii TaxID=1789227 RepID=UPI0029CA0090|nr:flap endonuclease-1 [Methanovulcanius yangii]MBT8507518.1 flap structure-specific endonuclease [Methanovulcanius yangii]
MGVGLREILADYKTTVSWDALAGSAAIDGNNALYQFLTIIRQPDGTPLMDREGRVTSHLSGLFFRTATLMEKGIRPVYVFDGKPPDLKMRTIEERRAARSRAAEAWSEALAAGDEKEAYKQARSATRLDKETVEGAQELLRLMGVPYLTAPSEGEAQAAYMAQRGDVSYAVSQDYDSLLFGVPVLVRNLTVSGKRKIRGRTISVEPERIVLAEVLAGLSITRDDLIRMGILIGTDFNTGIRGIGPKTALKIVRAGTFDETMAEKAPETDVEPIFEFFRTPPVTTDYTVEWRTPDEDGIHDLLCNTYDFSSVRVKAVLEKMRSGSGQKTLDHWF